MNRRVLLGTLSAALMTVAGAVAANAQSRYPSRPIRIILGFPAGTATDILARIYADELSKKLDTPVVIENMAGAASNIGAAAAARAEPDGYTFFMATSANATSISLYKNLRYDFRKDFEPIALLASAPPVLSVSSESKIGSVKELIDVARSKPMEILFGSSGVGTAPHMSAELLNMMADIRMTHVPYKGTNEAISDLLTGRLTALFSPLPTVSGLAGQGKLKIIATTNGRRLTLDPELPTVAEAGVPGFDTTLWFGLMAPRGTPPEIVKTVADAAASIGQMDEVKERLKVAGGEPKIITGDAFKSFIENDIETWAKVVKHTGLEPR